MRKNNRKFVTLLLVTLLICCMPIQAYAAADESSFVAVGEGISSEEKLATDPDTTAQKVGDVADTV